MSSTLSLSLHQSQAELIRRKCYVEEADGASPGTVFLHSEHRSNLKTTVFDLAEPLHVRDHPLLKMKPSLHCLLTCYMMDFFVVEAGAHRRRSDGVEERETEREGGLGVETLDL